MKKYAIQQSSRLKTIDPQETYGRHIFAKTVKNIQYVNVLDLGCGHGDDLSIAKQNKDNVTLYGIDCFPENFKALKKKGIHPINIDIEKHRLPFEDESLDLIIANQVLEHTKEIFWINHEVFRTLKVGGHFYIGVPNVLSFHNRVLGLLGTHPTQHKLLSAHVRPFSKKDTELFYNLIGRDFLSIENFAGSQFYPFPKQVARFLSGIFPSLSFSIFFLIKKKDTYKGEFIGYLEDVFLETNFRRNNSPL